MDQETRNKVIQNMTTERDLRNQIDYAKQEAAAEGRAEGRAEGDKNRALKIAQEMLADGMPIDKISKYTDLSVEEIMAL